MSKENLTPPSKVNRKRLSRRELLHDVAVVTGGILIVGGFDGVLYTTLSHAAEAKELLDKDPQAKLPLNNKTKQALQEINNNAIKDALIGAGAMVGGLIIWIKEAITD